MLTSERIQIVRFPRNNASMSTKMINFKTINEIPQHNSPQIFTNEEGSNNAENNKHKI